MSSISSTDGAKGLSATFKYVLVGGMLISGTINTVVKSIQNQEKSVGNDGTSKLFKKPWTQTLLMFFGEALCFLMFLYQDWRAKKRFVGDNGELVPDADYRGVIPVSQLPSARQSKWSVFLFLIPASLDLMGTSVAGIALLYVDASVWQMLRGSIIIFSAILSAIFLKQKKHWFHWFGLLITFGGLAVVGSASVLNTTGKKSDKDTKQTGIGLVLIVIGQLFSSTQMIVEEKLLKQRQLPPLKIVGLEGCWGALIMTAGVLPVMYYVKGKDNGSYEDALDAATMIRNNTGLLIFVILYVLSIAFYNFAGLSVAKSLTSVHRTLIDSMRTISVWGSNLLVYQFTKNHYGDRFGEKWGKYSPVQIAGFGLLVLGTLIYNKVLILPGFDYGDFKKPAADKPDEIPLHQNLLGSVNHIEDDIATSDRRKSSSGR